MQLLIMESDDTNTPTDDDATPLFDRAKQTKAKEITKLQKACLDVLNFWFSKKKQKEYKSKTGEEYLDGIIELVEHMDKLNDMVLDLIKQEATQDADYEKESWLFEQQIDDHRDDLQERSRDLIIQNLEQKGVQWPTFAQRMEEEIKTMFEYMDANIKAEAEGLGDDGLKKVVYDEITMSKIVDAEVKKFRAVASNTFPPKLEFIMEKKVLKEFYQQLDTYVDKLQEEADPELWAKKKKILGDLQGQNREDDKKIEYWYQRFESIYDSNAVMLDPKILEDTEILSNIFGLLVYAQTNVHYCEASYLLNQFSRLKQWICVNSDGVNEQLMNTAIQEFSEIYQEGKMHKLMHKEANTRLNKYLTEVQLRIDDEKVQYATTLIILYFTKSLNDQNRMTSNHFNTIDREAVRRLLVHLNARDEHAAFIYLSTLD